MARLVLLCAVLALSWASASPSGSAAETRAFIGARIVPIEGDVIPRGVIVTSGKTIVSVGAAGKVEIPGDAEQIDVDGHDPRTNPSYRSVLLIRSPTNLRSVPVANT